MVVHYKVSTLYHIHDIDTGRDMADEHQFNTASQNSSQNLQIVSHLHHHLGIDTHPDLRSPQSGLVKFLGRGRRNPP